MHAEKDFCFYKNSTNLLYLTFTFVICIVVYFDLSETKFSLSLNVPHCCQTITLAVGAMAESLHI